MGKFSNIYRERHKLIMDNFVGGIAWSLGVSIGATLVLAILAFILSKINYVPLVGGFVAQIVEFVANNSPNLVQ